MIQRPPDCGWLVLDGGRSVAHDHLGLKFIWNRNLNPALTKSKLRFHL
jgi:hypothetical protein